MNNQTPTAQSGLSDRAIAQAFREAGHGAYEGVRELYAAVLSRASEIDATPPAGARDAVTDEVAEIIRVLRESLWVVCTSGQWELVKEKLDRLAALTGKADGAHTHKWVMDEAHPSTEACQSCPAIRERYATRPAESVAQGGEDLEIAEAALQRFHDKFMERAHVDPSTGYPEYGSQEDYYIDLCSALEAVKALQDVPADPRETGLSGDEP